MKQCQEDSVHQRQWMPLSCFYVLGVGIIETLPWAQSSFVFNDLNTTKDPTKLALP